MKSVVGMLTAYMKMPQRTLPAKAFKKAIIIVSR